MKKNYVLGCIVLLAMLSLQAVAQTVSIPYSMSFESSESAELANWQINPGPDAANCAEQWLIGTDLHSDGTQSLYISDTLTMARFAAKADKNPNTLFVYRDFLLPAGVYDLTFDWYCEGASTAKLHAGYLPGTGTTLNNVSTSATLNTTVSTYAASAGCSGLYGQEHWQTSSFSFTSNGTRVVRVFFAWTNTCMDPAQQGVGACIDNIQITSAGCMRPYDLKAENVACDSVKVSWSGTSASYELAYRRTGSNVWRTESNIPDGVAPSYIVEGLDDGSYDFRVRGVCNNEDGTTTVSAWTTLNAHIVVCQDASCVNFLAIDDPKVATCTYGETDYDYGSSWGGAGASYDTYKNTAYQNIGIIDYGPESSKSRHTINWDRNATDPRTGNQLKLVPAGELASVRLGNWEWGNGAESVSYDYVVDSANSILLLKYAVVMEDPGHDEQEQPRFVLEILNSRGELVDPDCGACNFAAGIQTTGWHQASGGVVWKDWTTIGLNLENYKTQTIKIRLTTYDCFLGGHFGSAYSTLSCAAASVETTSCASDVNLNLTAPDGFSYQWIADATGQVVGTGKNLSLPSNQSGDFTCVLTSLENANCHFELHAQSLPRVPVADFTYNYVPADCKNRVEFVNKSFIRASGVDHHELGCEEYLWSFDYLGQESTGENPMFVYPAEGGTFNVTLSATIAEGRCTADTTIAITLPAVQDFNATTDTVICEGGFLDWGGQIITQPGRYELHTKTVAGCDSDHVAIVTVVPRYEQELDTVEICYGEQFCVDGDCYRSTTRSGMFIRTLTSANGCDSTLLQYVQFYDEVAPVLVIDSINLSTGKYTADVHIGGAGYTGYDATFYRDGHEVSETHTPGEDLLGLSTGSCRLHFYNEHGCERFDTVMIGSACLHISMHDQELCHGGQPVVIIPLTVDSGVLTRYSVAFDAEALQAGFVDMPMQTAENEELVVDVPAGVEPGRYNATVTLEDPVCGDLSYDIHFTLTYPSSVIFYRWGDVISLKNQAAAGFDKYEFSAYQWYLDGAAIEGATRSYYQQTGGLTMDGEYVLELTRTDGQVFRTCPFVPNFPTATDNVAGEVLVSPTMPQAGEQVVVRLSEAATGELYAPAGQLVGRYNFETGVNSLQAPAAPGLYILNVHGAHGAQAVRIAVR